MPPPFLVSIFVIRCFRARQQTSSKVSSSVMNEAAPMNESSTLLSRLVGILLPFLSKWVLMQIEKPSLLCF